MCFFAGVLMINVELISWFEVNFYIILGRWYVVTSDLFIDKEHSRVSYCSIQICLYVLLYELWTYNKYLSLYLPYNISYRYVYYVNIKYKVTFILSLYLLSHIHIILLSNYLKVITIFSQWYIIDFAFILIYLWMHKEGAWGIMLITRFSQVLCECMHMFNDSLDNWQISLMTDMYHL